MANKPSRDSYRDVFLDAVRDRTKLLFRLALAVIVLGAIVAGNGDTGSWFFTTPAHGFAWPAAGHRMESDTPDAWQTCTGGSVTPGDGSQNLAIIGPCTVSGGTYKYKNVNIYRDVAHGGDANGGSLTFVDDTGSIEFWAAGILVENHGAIVAGAPTNPFKSKLTIHLYGVEQANKYDGIGIACRSPVDADFPHCGIPEAIWNSNPSPNPNSCEKASATKVKLLPGGVDDCFYKYHPMPFDGGDPNAFFGYKALGVSYGGTLQLFGNKGATYCASYPCPP